MSTQGNVAQVIPAETRNSEDINEKNMVYRQNKTVGSLATGDVVVRDDMNSKGMKTTTTLADITVIGVIPQKDNTSRVAADQTIAADGWGYVQTAGDIAKVNVTATTAIGNYLIASVTPKKADPVGYVVRGMFAVATSACTGAGTVSAHLFPIDLGIDPPGTGKEYYGATLPNGYLWQDGAAVSRTTYATLFAAISTNYGVGDNSTTFNVPDHKGRTGVGKGAHSDVDALNDNDGLTDANRTPKHTHTGPSHTHTANIGVVTTDEAGTSAQLHVSAASGVAPVTHVGGGGATAYPFLSGVSAGGTGATGAGNSGYVVVNFIIKV